MLLTVAPPVCVAKYSTTKTPEHRHAHRNTDRQHGTLKLNSVNAVELEKTFENNYTIIMNTKMYKIFLSISLAFIGVKVRVRQYFACLCSN